MRVNVRLVMRRADPATAAVVLGDVARTGPYFVLSTEPRPAGRPLAALYGDGPDLDGLIDDYARRMGTGERRVAASILFLGLAARLWSPALGGVTHRVIPDLDPAHLHWWCDTPFGLRAERPGGWEGTEPGELAGAVAATVVDANLRPLAAAIRRRVRLADGLLWGNAASALVGSLRMAEDAAGPVRAVVGALLDRDPLAAAMSALPRTGAPDVRRRSCCLYYRVPGAGLCGDCGLDHVPRAR